MNKNRTITCMDEEHRQEALDFVEHVFTKSEGKENGKTVMENFICLRWN